MKKYTAVGMHIYAGGFSVGMQRHFDVRCHLEELTLGVSSFKLNYPKIPVYLSAPEKWPLKKLVGKTDVLFCNPPCNSWSACSASVFKGGENWKTDNRTNFTKTCFRTFVKLRPHIFIWESVCRASSLGAELVSEFVEVSNKLGYDTTHLFIDLAKIGGSQQRRRFLFIAHDRQLVSFTNTQIKGKSPQELLIGIIPTKHKYLYPKKEILLLANQTIPGHELRETFDRLNPLDTQKRVQRGNRFIRVGRPPFTMIRLSPDTPCPTLTSMNTLIHWSCTRNLAPNEAALLMGYPMTYKFDGPPETHLTQIAKGVSPIVGDFIGRHIHASLLQNKKILHFENKIFDYR